MASIEDLTERARQLRAIADEHRRDACIVGDPLASANYNSLATSYEDQATGLDEAIRLIQRIDATTARTKARRDAIKSDS